MRIERGRSGYNLNQSQIIYNHEFRVKMNKRTSEQSISSVTFCPRSWSLTMAALKLVVARAWLSIYIYIYNQDLFIRFKV